MRTTCKWLQHLTHINAGSGSSLALAGVNIWLPLCSLSTQAAGLWKAALLVGLLAHLCATDMLACCVQTCSLMQTLTGIVLLLR